MFLRAPRLTGILQMLLQRRACRAYIYILQNSTNQTFEWLHVPPLLATVSFSNEGLCFGIYFIFLPFQPLSPPFPVLALLPSQPSLSSLPSPCSPPFPAVALLPSQPSLSSLPSPCSPSFLAVLPPTPIQGTQSTQHEHTA